MSNISKVEDSQSSYQVGSKNLRSLIGGPDIKRNRFANKRSNQGSPTKRLQSKNSFASSPFKNMQQAEPLKMSPKFEMKPEAVGLGEDGLEKVAVIPTTLQFVLDKRSKQTSGESMSTNDQSNPSPNTPNDGMQVRTQIL